MKAKVRMGKCYENDIMVEFKEPVWDESVNDWISVVGMGIDIAAEIFPKEMLEEAIENEDGIEVELDEEMIKKVLRC